MCFFVLLFCGDLFKGILLYALLCIGGLSHLHIKIQVVAAMLQGPLSSVGSVGSFGRPPGDGDPPDKKWIVVGADFIKLASGVWSS